MNESGIRKFDRARRLSGERRIPANENHAWKNNGADDSFFGARANETVTCSVPKGRLDNFFEEQAAKAFLANAHTTQVVYMASPPGAFCRWVNYPAVI